MADVLHGAYNIAESDYANDREYQAMVPRMKAFIFPSIPRADFEVEAFNKAVLYQIEHEHKQAEIISGQVIPSGVRSFNIGEFSMSFDDGAFDQRLTRKTICPTAYGILLEAGLLYRGVEGRLPCYGAD